MLDLFVYKGSRYRYIGGLDWRPHIKPTARHIPLSQHSAHFRAIHSTWPLAEINRLHRLSIHRDGFEHFKQITIHRFEQFGLDPIVIERCRTWQPIPKSKIAQEMISVSSGRYRVVRCILPFHELFCTRIKQLQTVLQCNWDLLLRNILRGCQLQFGWANHARPLSLALRNHRL